METRIVQAIGRRRLLRGLLRQVHLWLGLTAGFFLALIGLSGAALVFAEQMVRGQQPALYTDVGDSREWRPVSEWIASAEKKYPELAPLNFVFAPGTIPMPTGVPLIFKLTKKGGEERHTLIPIDPRRGEALDRIDAEDTWAGWLVIFHKELLLHDIGAVIVAVCGIVGLGSVASGIYLWWPRRGRWLAAFKIRPEARGSAFLYDLHSAPAAWLLLPMSVVIFSGLWILKPKWVDPIVGLASSISSPPPHASQSSAPGSCVAPTTVDQAIALAIGGREGLKLRHVFVPMAPTGSFSIELQEKNANTRAEGTAVYVDRHCPRILHAETADTQTAGDVLKAWKWPLHTDLALGLPGQILVFLSGLLLPVLMITGLLHWLATQGRR